jgi:hypothetical protein
MARISTTIKEGENKLIRNQFDVQRSFSKQEKDVQTGLFDVETKVENNCTLRTMMSS